MAADDYAALAKARSLLTILLATCRQTLLALEATGNSVDRGLTDDLRSMIDRSEDELETITAKLSATKV